MSPKKEVYVSLEFTPNPNTLKYVVSQQLIERGAANFTEKSVAEQRSPLAAHLLGIEGVSGVMIGKNFVTVTKTEEGDWDAVHQNASSLIEKFLLSDQPVLIGDAGEGAQAATQGQNETERQIIEILDQEIRPAVAMDGGDITFERYEDGIVYLHLQGACAGCPGATMTLKMGVENRLREAIPEIQEVVAV